MDEQWKDIEGYENMFQISDLGRVLSLPRKYVKKIKFRKLHSHKDGYIFVYLTDKLHGKKNKTYSIHRLVAKHFLPNPESLPEVNHLDFNRTNNVVNNLEWVSSQQNALHTLRYGRIHGVKLDFKIADEIRKLYLTQKFTQCQLGSMFLVGQDEISRIVNNKIWRLKWTVI